MREVNIDENFLVDHECLDGYVRLPIRNNDTLKKLGFANFNGNQMKITDQQIVVLEEVMDSYEKDEALIRKVKKNIIAIWDSFLFLKWSENGGMMFLENSTSLMLEKCLHIRMQNDVIHHFLIC